MKELRLDKLTWLPWNSFPWQAIAISLVIVVVPYGSSAEEPSLFGIASFYGKKWHGGPTASGERYDMKSLTAAHRTLPFGTRVRVTNRKNGKSVAVRINNRGPFIKGRIIDLSLAAAEKLGMVRAGIVPVDVEILEKP